MHANQTNQGATVTGTLASYMAGARMAALPQSAVLQAKLRILDTLAAILSGSQLAPGTYARRYVASIGGTPEASVAGAGIRTSAANAALANAMFAHADETDDFEPYTKAHPGSHVVPAALAVAERGNVSGAALITAVALGYDVCCRFLDALDPKLVRGGHRSAEGTGSTLGAAAAAASAAGLDELQMRYVLSYAAQQVSGIWSWVRDPDHIEKAFDFAGMGARNGVTAAVMAQMGFTGVRDVFDGEHNALIALSPDPRPEHLIAGLGERFFVEESSIKPFSVGYPIQAPLSALLVLRREHGLTAGDVRHIRARLPEDGGRIVNNRSMPDVNCQYALAAALIDGTLSFENSHSYERMRDPQVVEVMGRVELVPDPALVDPAAPRSGEVQLTLNDGRTVTHFVRFPPGTRENPMSAEAVGAKALDLIAPVVGSERARQLIETVNVLEQETDMAHLSALIC